MNELTHRKIRFSDAARAIGVKPKTLRNWLQRNEIVLISDYATPGWTEFLLADIAVLAVMRELVRFGFPVDHANEIALLHLLREAGITLQYKNAPAAVLVAYLKPFRLFVYPEEDSEDLKSLMTQELSDALPDMNAVLVVRPGHVVELAFDRLALDDE